MGADDRWAGVSREVRFTYDLLKSAPDDGERHEILDGELYVTPVPNRRHQRLSKWIQHFLFQHVELEGRLGEVYGAPFDVILADDQVVQPDLLFVKKQRASLLSDRGLEGRRTSSWRSSRRRPASAT